MTPSCTVTGVPHAEAWVSAFTSSLRGVWLDPVFHFFTLFGEELFFIVVFTFGLQLSKRKQFNELALLVLGSALVNSWLKGWFLECRPLSVVHLINEVGYSFPSGHAQAAGAFWGLLFWRTTSLFQRGLIAIVMLMIALSRPYLGVHYFHDIAAGLMLGLLMSWAFHRWRSVFLQRPKIVFATLFVALLLSFLNPQESFKILGAFAGFAISGLISAKTGLGTGDDSRQSRILNFVLSVLGVFLFWWGLKVLFLMLGFENPVFSLIRYFVLAMWISTGALYFAQLYSQDGKPQLPSP